MVWARPAEVAGRLSVEYTGSAGGTPRDARPEVGWPPILGYTWGLRDPRRSTT